MALSLKERRISRRFLMRLPLTVRWTDESVVGEAATESREVSSRGLYFHLPKGLKSGSPVEIVMTLPHELTQAGPVRVRCLGRVLRSSPTNIQAKWEWLRRSNDTNSCGTAKTPHNKFLTQTLRRWVRKAGRFGSLSRCRPATFLYSLHCRGPFAGPVSFCSSELLPVNQTRASARIAPRQRGPLRYPPACSFRRAREHPARRRSIEIWPTCVSASAIGPWKSCSAEHA